MAKALSRKSTLFAAESEMETSLKRSERLLSLVVLYFQAFFLSLATELSRARAQFTFAFVLIYKRQGVVENLTAR